MIVIREDTSLKLSVTMVIELKVSIETSFKCVWCNIYIQKNKLKDHHKKHHSNEELQRDPSLTYVWTTERKVNDDGPGKVGARVQR